MSIAERVNVAAGHFEAPSFDVEQLDVYRVALEFERLLPQILPRKGQADLRNQLERASASVLLNLAEGCGRWAPGEKAHFYSIARGSAMECAAALDVLAARSLLSAPHHRHGRGLLARVVQMLTKLAVRQAAR